MQERHCDIHVRHCDMQVRHYDMQVRHCDIQVRYCDMQVRHCDIQVRHCDIHMRHCDMQVRHYDMQVRHCDIQVRPCDIQVRHCDMQVRHCDMQVRPCDMQVRHCDMQVRPCDIQVRPCDMQVRHCDMQVRHCDMQVRCFDMHVRLATCRCDLVTYRRKKEEKIRKMLDRLSNEQRSKVASMIQKHSQEMLLLIAGRLTAAEDRVSSDSEDASPTADLSKPPPVSPPEFKRSQLFKSPKEFEKIDNHVFQIVQKEYSTFTELVKDLIVVCETDLDKARAIFRWVTWTDLNELEVEDSVCPDSPMGLLRGIKYGTETYHDLCRRLCSYAGLYCEVIEGYSKGAGYKPGMKMESDRFRNSWTAVSINGSWCFINCNWGARHVKGEGRGEPGVGHKKKRDGVRLDSNTQTHYNNVEVLYEQDSVDVQYRGGVRRDSLENRESSGVPELNGERGSGAGPSGSLVTGVSTSGHYGYGGLFSSEPRLTSISENSTRSKLEGLSGNSNQTSLSGNSNQAKNTGYNGFGSHYSVANGYSLCSELTNPYARSNRKLLPDPGSNKENGHADQSSVVSVDGYTGRSLLDAFYNKDIKSKLTVARLSDGDTASCSSGYSKSSTENMSPSHSPFASISSTPGGAYSVNSDSSSSSHRDCDTRYSPPQSLFRSCRHNQDGCYGGLSRPSPPQSTFRNSSGSDNSGNSVRSSPPQSLFRANAMTYVTPLKTSPPSSIFRYASISSTQGEKLSPPQSDTER
ncbi:hypothetical protein Btru_019215 [Bulinus truncatus]|nr:hypothetical protein Btru_019215 [Bulinus truncatus]